MHLDLTACHIFHMYRHIHIDSTFVIIVTSTQLRLKWIGAQLLAFSHGQRASYLRMLCVECGSTNTAWYINVHHVKHVECEVGMGIWEWGIYGLNGWGIYDLNAWGIYD